MMFIEDAVLISQTIKQENNNLEVEKGIQIRKLINQRQNT